MIKDNETIQRLNLLSSSRAFVLKEIGTDGRASVLHLSRIPKRDGTYWIFGHTTLKCGRTLESVFVVDTESGGTLSRVFWRVERNWFDQQDPEILGALALTREEVFPYDWKYAVGLEEDIFHD